MTIKTWRACVLACLLCACAPPAGLPEANDSLFAATPSAQWALPQGLYEVSGLAFDSSGRLFAHDDERAVIYAIDAEQGVVLKAFALGDPIALGDFEGLAITPGGDFYLTTSQGRLYRAREGADGAQVAYQLIDTGLGDICEIEGLAFAASENSLILACKQMNDPGMRDQISLFAWPLDTTEPRVAQWLAVSESMLAQAAGVRRFQPSGVEIDAMSGRTLLLSAFGPALVELSHDGTLRAARQLRGHPQAEGLALAPDGDIFVADEARGGQARLTRYARAHD